jgi:hypothetical protein
MPPLCMLSYLIGSLKHLSNEIDFDSQGVEIMVVILHPLAGSVHGEGLKPYELI